MTKTVAIGDLTVGGGAPLFVVAGPCVIEDSDVLNTVAAKLKEETRKRNIGYIFKASYDKANRTSINSYRGPGLEDGLNLLRRLKEEHNVLIMSDVHQISEVEAAANVIDILQIPAFLCRQTDLVRAVAETGKVVNIKKGQFLSPWDIGHVLEKITATGNEKILVTERGASFGYNNLVVDMRSLPIMRSFGFPVLFDATHSVQLPGGGRGCSGGDRSFIAPLARAAVGAGVDGVFMEVHPDPEKALCDGPNSLPLNDFPELIDQLKAIDDVVKKAESGFNE